MEWNQKMNYKLEIWKKRTKREYPNSQIGTTKKGEKFFYSPKKVLVKRYPKGTMINNKNVSGQFIKGTFIIKEIRQKTYGSGVYEIGIINNKIIARHKISSIKTHEWQKTKEERLKTSAMYRCSLALNDIPYKGCEYYGFRIVAYSRRKQNLESVYPQKMCKKLIQFIEKCLRYRSEGFWFEHTLNYMGKIPPEKANVSISDNNKYELLWTKRKTGSILKNEYGYLGELQRC